MTVKSTERRSVPGFEGRYEVDQAGNVYSLRPSNGLKSGYLKKRSTSTDGYFFVALFNEQGRQDFYIHRLLMLTFNPVENSDQLEVNHKDGNKQNNDLSNLEWMTHTENMAHAYKYLNAGSNRPRGTSVHNAKLTPESVREIRRLWDGGRGMSRKELAAMFGVTPYSIGTVVTGKLWKHVKDEAAQS